MSLPFSPFRSFALSRSIPSPPSAFSLLHSAKCLIDRANYISRSAHEGLRSYKTLEFAVKKGSKWSPATFDF